MPTRVFLLRHAETAAPNVFHGAESDIGLSERGRKQVELIAPIVAAENPVVVVSSGMRRALDSARPIAEVCRVPLQIEPDLHERRVGALSGQPFGVAEWSETVRSWTTGNTAYAPEGAESLDDIRRRVVPIWHRVTDQYPDRTLVIVAHGAVNKVVLLSILAGFGPADWNRFRSHNLGINELVRVGAAWNAVRLGYLPEVFRNGSI